MSSPASDLQLLLSGILKMASSMLDTQGTWPLIIWILQVQRLPPPVLYPSCNKITSILRRAVEENTGKEQSRLDGLKVSFTNRLIASQTDSYSTGDS